MADTLNTPPDIAESAQLLFSEYVPSPTDYHYAMPDVFFQVLSNGQLLLKNNCGYLFTQNDLQSLRMYMEYMERALPLYEALVQHTPTLIEEANEARMQAQEQKYSMPVPKEEKNAVGFVYLMLDKNTGYYKIGYSATPHAREKTLQSEKPTIEMVCHCPGTKQTEKELHTLYAAKRVRGEWFTLTPDDVQFITATGQ